jgi:phage baseplate assembly protein W
MAIVGMSREDGTKLSEIEHLKQSIIDILTTPIGTRVMRRDYGSEIFDLIDAPLNGSTLLRLFAAAADALGRWEPRFRVTGVSAVRGAAEGSVVIDVTGEYLPGGETVNIEGIVIGDGPASQPFKRWDLDPMDWDSGAIWA